MLSSLCSASGLWPSSTERKTLFDPVMSFMGQKNEDDTVESSQKAESSKSPPEVEKSSVEPESPPKADKLSVEAESPPKVEQSSVEPESPPEVKKSSVEPESPQHPYAVEEKIGVSETLPHSATEQTDAEENEVAEEEKDENHAESAEETKTLISEPEKSESESHLVPVEAPEPTIKNAASSDFVGSQEENKISEVGPSDISESAQGKLGAVDVGDVEEVSAAQPSESHDNVDVHENVDDQKAHKENDNEIATQAGDIVEMVSSIEPEELTDSLPGNVTEPSAIHSVTTEVTDSTGGSSTNQLPSVYTSNEASDVSSESVFKQRGTIIEEPEIGHRVDDNEANYNEQRLSSGEKSDSSVAGANVSDASNAFLELEKMKKEMKMMEAALQGAARQAQVHDAMIMYHLIS